MHKQGQNRSPAGTKPRRAGSPQHRSGDAVFDLNTPLPCARVQPANARRWAHNPGIARVEKALRRLHKAKTTMRKALLFVSLALLLAACGAPSAPRAAPKSMAIPSVSKIAKGTRSPARRASATPEPMETPTASPSAAAPEPTETLTTSPFATLGPMPSLAPTVPVPSPLPTPTVPNELDCKLIWQSPSNRVTFPAEEKFTVGWNVRNNGTAVWDPSSFQFTYLDGAKLSNDGSFPLQTSVAPGETVVLSVPMRAPRNSTKYTTYWGLRRGDTFFCRLKLSIYVTEVVQ
jgi:hypothetical protein